MADTTRRLSAEIERAYGTRAGDRDLARAMVRAYNEMTGGDLAPNGPEFKRARRALSFVGSVILERGTDVKVNKAGVVTWMSDDALLVLAPR